MIKRFSISSTLVLVITVIFVSSILIVTSLSYLDSEKRLHDSFDRERMGTEDLFNKSSVFIHGGLKLWASTYNYDLKQKIQIILDAYNKTNGHPENLNLSEIKAEFDPDIRDKIDLYLINKSGVIEYTTYESELNYDFSSLEDFMKDLENIRSNDSFVPDEIVRGMLPGAPLRKFAYHSTSDHQYVAQISLNVQNDSIPERAHLSYSGLISYINNRNANLEKLHVFNSFGSVTIGKEDYSKGTDNIT